MNYIVRPKNGFTIASMALMAVFAALRVYCFRDLSGFWAWAYLYVPVGAAVLFVAFLLLFGRRTLLPLCLPVVGGVAFFIVKAFTFASPLHTALCCALYMAVLLLTCLTQPAQGCEQQSDCTERGGSGWQPALQKRKAAYRLQNRRFISLKHNETFSQADGYRQEK